jgi:hypothetical protein
MSKVVLVYHENRHGDKTCYLVPEEKWPLIKVELHRHLASDGGCPGGEECVFGIHPDTDIYNGGKGVAPLLKPFPSFCFASKQEEETRIDPRCHIIAVYYITEVL